MVKKTKKKTSTERKTKIEQFWNDVLKDNSQRSETMIAYLPGGMLVRTRSFARSTLADGDWEVACEALVFVPITN